MSLFSIFVELKADVADFVSGMSGASFASKKAARDIKESFSGLGELAEKALAPLGEVGEAIGSSLAGVADAAGMAGSKLATLGSLSIAGTIGGIATAAVSGAAALSALAIKGSEVVENLKNISARTGISISDLQTFGAAGESVGVSLDDVVTGMRKFDQVLTNTGRGTGPLNSTLKALGVTATDNKNALLQLADAFSTMEDGPRKDAIAVELLGRSGLNLIPILDKGRAGIEEFQAIITEFGPNITADAITATDEWKTSTLELSEAWQKAEINIEKGILPTVSSLTDKIAYAISKWNDFIALLPKGSLEGVLHPGFDTGGRIAQWQNPQLPNTGLTQQQRADADASARGSTLAMSEYKARADELKQAYERIAGGSQNDALQQLLQKLAVDLNEGNPNYKEAGELVGKITSPRASFFGGADKDEVADMLSKLSVQSSSQLSLASAIEQTTAATTLAKAATEGDLKLAETRTALLDREKTLRRELAQAKATSHPEDAARYPQEIVQIAKFSEQIASIQSYIGELDKDAPLVKQRYAEIAAASIGTGTNEELAKESVKFDTEIGALGRLVAAYSHGRSAIADADISKQLDADREKVTELSSAYSVLAATQPGDAEALGQIATSLRNANAALDDHAKKLQQLRSLSISVQIAQETAAFKGQLGAMQGLAAAYAKGADAVRAAEVELKVADFRGKNPAASDEQTSQVAALYRQQSEAAYAGTIAQAAAQYNLNGELSDEIERLTRIGAVLRSNGQSELSVEAAIYDAKKKSVEQWDEEIAKVGSLSEKYTALTNQIQLEGQGFGAKIFSSMSTAVDGFETQLSKLVVTGKANFRELFDSFAESAAKAEFQNIFGNLAGLFAGKDRSLAPPNRFGPNAPGGTPGILPGSLGSAGGGGSVAGGIVSSFGKIFGLSGKSGPGGAPDGSQASPFFVVSASGAGGVGGLPTKGFNFGGLNALFGSGSDDSDSGGSGDSDSGGSGIGGFFANVFHGLASIFGGGKAGGGDMSPGKVYLVGENGPELMFAGHRGGTIAPIAASRGGHTIHNEIHIHGVSDFDSFRRSSGQIMAGFHRQTQSALARNG